MSTMYGADVAQLRDLALQFDSAASRLDGDRMAVGNAIQISAWVGPVAVRFRAQWDSDHSRRLHAAAERLRSAALALRANADDQERTSAVYSSRATGTRVGDSGTLPSRDGEEVNLTDHQRDSLERLLESVKLADTVTGGLDGLDDLLAAIKSGRLEYGSLSEWVGKVKGLDAGTLLSLAGMGITAKELGEAIGADDPAETLRASLDLIMGGVGVYVPQAGLAWGVGTFLGESGYNALQTVYDSPSSALDFAARQMFGGDATFGGLEQYQRDALMTRYEGMGGLLVSFVDSAGGAWDDFWKWAGTGQGRGPGGG